LPEVSRKPSWLADPDRLWAPWRLTGADLAAAKKDATLLWIKEQEEAGIDIITDGEQSRQHFVHGFLEFVDGIDVEHKVKMGISDNRYEAMVPVVVGPLRLKGRIHETEAKLARTHTDRKLKMTRPRPLTIVDTIADRHYGNKKKMAMAFAALLNQEARALEKDGVDVIQFDEPAFNVYADDVKAWGIEALHRSSEGLKCTTAVAYLLRLRHSGEHRLEEDARQRVAAVRGDLPRGCEEPYRSGVARVHELEGADGVDKAAEGEGCLCRGDRRGV
jgi:5-methyltetrahydropteroyltriglutamate--homocysteine methyltransferase